MSRKRKQHRSNNRIIIAGALLALALLSVFAVNAFTAGTITLIDPTAYQQQFGDGQKHVLLDVRTPEEYATGHIAGSVNINVEELAMRLDEVPEGMPVVVYCRSGNRSATASEILLDAGYREIYDLGGIQSWIALGLPIQ